MEVGYNPFIPVGVFREHPILNCELRSIYWASHGEVQRVVKLIGRKIEPLFHVQGRVQAFLISIGTGVALMIISGFLAGFAGGACHCVAPTAVAFPYSSILWGTFSYEFWGLALVVVQFPVYSALVISVRSPKVKFLALLIIVTIHVAAVTLALKVYKHG